MCVVSLILDATCQRWGAHPFPDPLHVWPGITPVQPQAPFPVLPPYVGPTPEQFRELIELLKAAKRFDAATGQPDCEMESKKQLLRDIAKRLGVDVEIP